MGCEQLVQHAKVSKNRKFIPHFRENLARPLDKGGVGVVYLPCNPQSAASVREVINTANRLIHRVTAEVINPFQQLSTLYRHVVDTSPPLGRTAAPVYSRAAALFHRFTAAPLPGFPLHRSLQHRFICIAPPFSRRATALPSCFSLYRFSVAPKHLCLFPALPRHRFTAAPFHLCTAALLHRSSLRGSAASPLRRFRPLLLENPFLLFVFPFPGCLSPPLSRDVCPASAPAGYPEPPTRRQLSAPHPKSRSTSWLGRFHPRRSNRGPCGSAAPERRMEGRGVGGVRGAGMACLPIPP